MGFIGGIHRDCIGDYMRDMLRSHWACIGDV